MKKSYMYLILLCQQMKHFITSNVAFTSRGGLLVSVCCGIVLELNSVPQGLEIVNPHAAEKKVAEANQKYFSNMAEFLKVKKEGEGK